MASMNCPKCGTPNDLRGTFCGNCGYALQAAEAATSSPQLGGEAPPPPSLYPSGNMSSSPNYAAGGAPPPTFYPPGNAPSSFTFPASGSPPPPPPFPPGSMPSSPTYPASGSSFPPATYPKSEPNLPPPQPQRPRRGKGGIFAILIIALIVILAGGGLVGYLYITHSSPLFTSTSSTPTRSITATAVATTAPSTPTQSTTATATTTSATSTPTQSTTATATAPPTSSSNYSATQPGPGCDTNGGTWTPQGISKISCGTQISVSSGNARGYLYLQLPNNTAFSSNNIIGITGNVTGSTDCVGLAELDANTGFLAEYCGSGQWYIYSISSTGAIVKTLAQSITSTRTSEQLLLTLSGTTLSFSIDNEVHKINVSPIQPTKVAVTFTTTYVYGGSVTITNFSYTIQSS